MNRNSFIPQANLETVTHAFMKYSYEYVLAIVFLGGTETSVVFDIGMD